MASLFTRFNQWFKSLFRGKESVLETRVVRFRYPEGRHGDAESETNYSDSFFLSAHGTSPNLCPTSLALALSAFSSNGVKQSLEKQNQNVLSFLFACGFTDIETPEYFSKTTDIDGVAYAIGRKQIKHNKEKFTLIAVGVRGGNYGKEWASNATVGEEKDHLGFRLASERLVNAVTIYLGKHNLKKDVRIWISGFSRGGAITNLFVQKMPQIHEKARISRIFAYCFACPNVTQSTAESARDIQNVLLDNDLIPLLPLTEWGYHRYGKDHVLPQIDAKPFYHVTLDVLRLLDKHKRRRKDPGYDRVAFLSRFTQLLASRITRENYVLYLQEPLRDLFALVNPALENPYSPMADALKLGFAQVTGERGIVQLLGLLAIKRTDWNAILSPAFEKAFHENNIPLDGAKIASGMAKILLWLRGDILSDPNFFLTLIDTDNLTAILDAHRPSSYLSAIKKAVLSPMG